MINKETKQQVKAILAKIQDRKTLAAKLAALDAELQEYGITADEAPAPPQSKKNRRPTVKLNEAAVLKFFGTKELSYHDVAAHFSKSAQTTRTWLEKSKKFSKRNVNPKNKKSKVLYQVK